MDNHEKPVDGIKPENSDRFVEDFDEEKASVLFEKVTEEAEELLKDEDRMERFLQRLENKFKTVPVAGNALAYIPVMISMIRSYVKGDYKDPPVTSIIVVIAVLIYYLSPIDIIPDFIPLAGYSDDGLVAVSSLALVRTDIEDYRLWRKENGLEIEDLPDYEKIKAETKSNSKIADAFFKGFNAKK